ncbi:MAG: PAS domain-containing protein [Phycisphaerae bacterium]|nr:PAS domain-containing protein [Phycisphaerae bacterium]
MTISVRGKLEWLFVLAMLVGGTCIAWGVGRPEGDVLHRNMNYLGLLILVTAAMGSLGAFRRSHRKLLLHLGEQLESVQGGVEGHIVLDRSDEDAWETRPVNHGLAILGKQMDEFRLANQALTIHARLAKTQQQQSENILGLVSDAVFVTNRFDELIYANQAAEHLLGFQLSASLRRNIDQVLSDGVLIRLIREARTTGLNHPRQVVEHTFDAHHTPQTFRMTLNCIAGPNGAMTAVVAILHDVTREKEVERSKTEFVANVSHELKTPLASIKAYTEMLMDGEVSDPESIQDFYRTISGETERLHGMIDRILTVSRIESGAVPVSLEPVSMTAVVKQVTNLIAPQIQAKRIQVEEELPPVYYQVEADYDLICQAVLNLASNAVKYTPEEGMIRIAVLVDEKRGVVTTEIADTGVGIPPEDLGRVFDKFYRVRTNSAVAPGTGLGLPLAKFIVESIHNGTISVISEPGVGSTFSFELPLMA